MIRFTFWFTFRFTFWFTFRFTFRLGDSKWLEQLLETVKQRLDMS